MAAAKLFIKTDKLDKDMVKIIFSIYVKAHDHSKEQHEAKILFTNQRPPAERGPGPFEGPSCAPVSARCQRGASPLQVYRSPGL